MRWYAVLFWIWVLVSLGIFVYRRISGTGRTTTPDEVETSPLDREWAPPPTDPDAVASVTTAVDDDAEVEPAPDTGSARGPERGSGATLADLLSGITLPHGLVPLTQASPSAGPTTSIILATDTATPEEVGTALADEIERLGYEVRSTGEQTALAEGPRGALEIEIHPDSSTAVDGGTLRFPTAPPHSVVVELRVARGTGAL